MRISDWSSDVCSSDLTRSLADALKQPKLRIALPRAGSTDEYTFRFIMKHYGTSYEAIRANGGKVVNADYNDIVSAFKDDQVDGFRSEERRVGKECVRT